MKGMGKMKKVVSSIVIILFTMLMLSSSAFSSSFELRNGIRWYISKSDVYQCLQAESDYDKYEIYDEKNNEAIQNAIYQMNPKEKENPKIWWIIVKGISLGRDDESVQLSFCGTIPDGLYDAFYDVIYDSGSEEECYARVKELTEQLSKKYGQFTVQDKWKSRNSVKNGVSFYDSWIHLDDKTSILCSVRKREDGYRLSIEYQCIKVKEIEQSIKDGSIYIEPAFGL